MIQKRKSFLALLLWYKDKKHEHYPDKKKKKKKKTLNHIKIFQKLAMNQK